MIERMNGNYSVTGSTGTNVPDCTRQCPCCHALEGTVSFMGLRHYEGDGDFWECIFWKDADRKEMDGCEFTFPSSFTEEEVQALLDERIKFLRGRNAHA